MTDWSPGEGGPVLGIGARLFVVDDEPVPLHEWRQYLRNEPETTGHEPEAAGEEPEPPAASPPAPEEAGE
jgi:hypothetical protein